MGRHHRYPAGFDGCSASRDDASSHAAMVLMLATIFLFLTFGLLMRRLGPVEQTVIVAIAGAMTASYSLFANRVF